jgi:hypothetical protein
MNLIHNQIGEIPVEVLAKVQWTFANWRNSRGSIGESSVEFRHWRKSYWRNSYWRKSEFSLILTFNILLNT